MASLDFVVDTFVGADGSRYYGTLRNGVPSGLGTCIWPNNCHYDGEWRNGVMHGFGTYVWKNGQRYDGEWKVCKALLRLALWSCRLRV
jgi:1-phosphatidylinositol-4-phosphate 5-kinase